MSKKYNRKEIEISCGRIIVDKAEKIWGWGTEAGKIRVIRRAKLIAEQLSNEVNKILEIGCGVGTFTKRIAVNRKIIATDISYDLLKKAQINCKNNCFFIVADAERLPFKAEIFNVVFGSSVLHHLNLGSALREMKRLLKKNGKIVFAEPNIINPEMLIKINIRPIKKWLNVLPHETAFFRWKLKKVLLKNGFYNINIKPFDFLHPIVPKFLINIVMTLGSFLERIPLIKEIAGSLLIVANKV